MSSTLAQNHNVPIAAFLFEQPSGNNEKDTESEGNIPITFQKTGVTGNN